MLINPYMKTFLLGMEYGFTIFIMVTLYRLWKGK